MEHITGHTGSVVAIFARDANYGIGKKNDLPWKRELPTDLNWFKRITNFNTNAILVCGRKTAETLPLEKMKDRQIVVLTRTPYTGDIEADNVTYITFEALADEFPTQDYLVIGGGEIYSLFLPYVELTFETIVCKNYYCDTKMKPFHPNRFRNLESVLRRNLDKSKLDVIFQASLRRGSSERLSSAQRKYKDLIKLIPGLGA